MSIPTSPFNTPSMRHQYSKSATPMSSGLQSSSNLSPFRQRNKRNQYDMRGGSNEADRYSTPINFKGIPVGPSRVTPESFVVSDNFSGNGKRSKLSTDEQNVNASATITPTRNAHYYAGATFHASPEPSALPIPKFVSKSLPSSASRPSLRARLESVSDQRKLDGSPHGVRVQPVLAESFCPESPLDFIFRADREEKAKKLVDLS